jgi:hypothetical protein
MTAMPGTINGIGTCLCGGRGHVSWQPRGRFDLGRDATDYDALECFCVAFLPIVPYRALHAFGRTGSGTGYTYRRVPIRWSLSLLVRTFLRRWLWAPCVSGALLTIIALSANAQGPGAAGGPAWGLLIAAITLTAGSCFGWWLLKWTDSRRRRMGIVLGPSEFGTSDPAAWRSDLLEQVADPRQLFRSESFARASMRAIEQQDWSAAMRAARLCAALEDVVAGERLTDEILSRAEVQAGIDAVLRRPEQWGEHFRPNAPEQVSGASEPGPQGAFAAI